MSGGSGDAYRTPPRLLCRGRRGAGRPVRSFHFDLALCPVCPLRHRFVAAAQGRGRQVSLHPQEDLLQAARPLQHSAAFASYRPLRQAVEHRQAPLVPFDKGIQQMAQ